MKNGWFYIGIILASLALNSVWMIQAERANEKLMLQCGG